LPVLLAGSKPLAEVFEASVENGRLVLVPRQTSSDVGRIVVTLRAPSFAIESADVLDAAGNHMRYAFAGMQRNAGLPRGVFSFDPPPGTEISGSHGG
jgi:outer membrane lipoprotein-sorting protein